MPFTMKSGTLELTLRGVRGDPPGYGAVGTEWIQSGGKTVVNQITGSGGEEGTLEAWATTANAAAAQALIDSALKSFKKKRATMTYPDGRVFTDVLITNITHSIKAGKETATDTPVCLVTFTLTVRRTQ